MLFAEPHHHFTRQIVVSACCLTAGAALAHPGHPSVVTVTGNYDNAVGSSDAASQGAISAALLRSRAIQRPGAVLEFVPGVAVTQHAGEGKANQYFLRGFNLDHGTDFSVRINGVPVNLPTHGHGQGYADMNYLIPELVQRIQYRKGPYDAHNGDFSAAGGADIIYRRSLDTPWLLDASLGPDRHRRVVAAGSGKLGATAQWLAGVELQGHDGPWTVPEHLRKRNAVFTVSGAEVDLYRPGARARHFGRQPWPL
jgi:outer membrane cobalamin receptor